MRYKILIIALTISTCACVAYSYAAGQQSPAPTTTSSQGSDDDVSRNTIFLTLLFGFLTSISMQIFKIMDDRRKRRWELDDKEAARKRAVEAAELQRQELITRAEIQRIATIQTAVELAKLNKQNGDKFMQALIENTKITEQTGAKAHEMLARLEGRLSAVSGGEGTPQLSDIAAVGQDTNTKVTQLQEVIDGAIADEGKDKKDL